MRTGWTPAKVVGAALIALAVYLGGKWWRQASYAPDPSIAAPLLDYIFADKHTVIAKGTDSTVSFPNLTRADIAGVTSFDCFPQDEGLALTRTEKFNRAPPTYDCAYRLTGADGANYVTVVRLVYLSDAELRAATDSYKPARDVGMYGVGNVPVDQAVTFLLAHQIALP